MNSIKFKKLLLIVLNDLLLLQTALVTDAGLTKAADANVLQTVLNVALTKTLSNKIFRILYNGHFLL